MPISSDDDVDLDRLPRNQSRQGKDAAESATDGDISATDTDVEYDRARKRAKKAAPRGELELWSGSEDEGAVNGFKCGSRQNATQRKIGKQIPHSGRNRTAVKRGDRTRADESSNAEQEAAEDEVVTQNLKPDDHTSSDGQGRENSIPDYVQRRRRHFVERNERLKKAGLMLPPTYEDIGFSDDDHLATLKEKPDLPNAPTQASYKDVVLPYSLGVVPASIAQYLRQYQVDGAAFLHELFVYQRGGVLGDDMGLGKTVQVIAFLLAAYGKTGDERDLKRMRRKRQVGAWYPRTLIICPSSLVPNWQDELQRWGYWHVEVYDGTARHRQDVLEAAKAGMLEIMIMTYDLYRTTMSVINTIEWDCVVADECHVLKSSKSERTKAMDQINALCRIGLTGTAIQNNYEELWTLLNWTSPGRFGQLSDWKRNISEPLKLGQSHDATMSQLALARKTAEKLVKDLLPQFFLRRMKTLIKDQLPKKTDRVVFCPLTPTQANAYTSFLNSEPIQTIKQRNGLCDCGSGKKSGWCCKTSLENGDRWQNWVLPAIIYLQRISNHLALLIPQNSDTKEKQEKDLDLLVMSMPDQWQKLSQHRNSMLNAVNPEFCGKFRVLNQLLKFWHDQGGNKVLVFSHSVKFLRMLQSLFLNTSLSVSYLDGSMNKDARYAAVHDFNTDPSQFVFLMSTKAGGVGLNITSANKVVIIDPNWNPSLDLQAQDRAYRIGQLRDVEVYRLISQGTLEEIMYARQIYKQQQANIAYNANPERRYFAGVQNRKDQKGEIFGLDNIFAYENENIVLRDIVHKTNVAESKAGIRIANLEVSESDLSHMQSEDSGSENEKPIHKRSQAASQDDEDEDQMAAMSQLADEIIGRSNKKSRRSRTMAARSSEAPNSSARTDPVQAILASAGISYTHENSEVIGSSRVEQELSRRAGEAAASQQRSRVFTEDKSQSQTEELEKFQFKYRPPEDVQKRQFCSMAEWAGYADDVVGFALVVERWTQVERRNFLDRWYAWRREVLLGLMKGRDGEERVADEDAKDVLKLNADGVGARSSDYDRQVDGAVMKHDGTKQAGCGPEGRTPSDEDPETESGDDEL